ncbi:hypothetical protein [Brachyspira murdochii]|uniref:hypothetical protein n=1 Tax=Brachyspira murdochii TaxID=84378 RepID=UPI0012F51DE9|nr:hypothetical protein [Brachyspira murdochii]
MKTKIFLILMMIIFVVSCTKNNPVNPVNISNNGRENNKIESGDNFETKNNTSSSQDSYGSENAVNTKASNANEDIEDMYIKDPISIFEGEGEYSIDGTKFQDKENIKIEIYDDCIEVYRSAKYFRFDITKQDNKYNLEKYQGSERHTLDMTINGNTASVTYTITVQGHRNENYHFHSDSLTKK